ncbi:YacL family protein [Pseudoalteromonas carrageenovora]|uniref:YacL family protein n=1 Tax=Pseudoalteromonas carrageenovora TaxID=227 RepID=UPI0026E2319E|nr:YacL family protein [Pseudoalteromonas carrageenovora]MDO6638320.1 YacL family protein [Pseudoalteromonas carrageenovora]MDO6650720.1 YacL family protein [Pseudoalteromonas carrageenovora]
MEYQFIRDPISGLRIKISSEHAIIGRWLNEEIGKDKVAMVQALITSVKTSYEPVALKGQEIDLILSKDEALFEAHALHQDSEDLVAYQDDDLMLEENGLSSGCGFEDFIDLIESWAEFSGSK